MTNPTKTTTLNTDDLNGVLPLLLSRQILLDADPFFGADGQGEGFVVEKIKTRDDSCWAEIHIVWDGKEDATPGVTPELTLKSVKPIESATGFMEGR